MDGADPDEKDNAEAMKKAFISFPPMVLSRLVLKVYEQFQKCIMVEYIPAPFEDSVNPYWKSISIQDALNAIQTVV